MENKATNFFTRNKGILIFMLVMLAVPFITGLIEGSTFEQVWTNKGSISKFLEGLGGSRSLFWRSLPSVMICSSVSLVCYPTDIACSLPWQHI